MREGNASIAAWERKLNIRTAAAAYEKEDAYHSPYEPTDYGVLDRLARSGWISGDDVVVDYGCGKGRAGFFLNHALGCGGIGVEYNPELHREALDNLQSYVGREKHRLSFVLESAENYEPNGANCFYFFNPFPAKILQSVLARIRESYYAYPRPLKLFFYFPLDSYLDLLMNSGMLQFAGEIDCRDLFAAKDCRERILIFRVD